MYRINEEIVIEDVEEGKCLINEREEKIILLKKVETKVFEYILNYPIDKVKELVLQEFEGENISDDIDVFVKELCDKNDIVNIG